ncbi:hypothetical protein HK096_004870, partial [Nowakowskiella sp. JEL0078]
VRSALMVLIYRKSMTLSRVRGGAAAIIVMAWNEINISALPAIGFVLLLFPVQMYLGRLTSITNREQTQVTTQRVHIMSEILTAIKLVKFYAWEKPFEIKINEVRDKEMKLIYRGMFVVVFTIPVWVALSSLGMYVALGNKLTAAVSFTVLSVYNTLRYPFFMLPLSVKSLAGAMTAFVRLNHFLTSEEIEEIEVSRDTGKGLAFEMWDGSEIEGATLSKINLSVKKGQKVGIIGDVGSGKSTLIAALLGQIRQVGGENFKIYGTTSYVPQQAWLLNETLRENILFGMPMSENRYKECIRVASLQRDISLLVAGDQTEIAERGANLSGGQRQRTSLARAIYHDCDIVLLDDPISAVDQNVGRHIFEECFMKYLKNKTVIVALHQLQYLPQLDHIVVLCNGKIDMQGSYMELMQNQSFANLINRHVASGTQSDSDEPDFHDSQLVPLINNIDATLPNLSLNPYDNSPVIERFSIVELTGRNQLTVRSRRSITSGDVQAMIERSFSTGIAGAEYEHDIAAIIERNQLSVYSTSDVGVLGDRPSLGAEMEHTVTQNTVNRRSIAKLKNIDEEKGDVELKELGKLVREDGSANAKSAAADYLAYGRVKQGILSTAFVCFFFSMVHGIRIGSDYWLRLWVPRVGHFTDAVYIGVYGAFTFAFGCGILVRGLWWARVSTDKSIQLHNNLFRAVLRAPMSFFDSTPL